MKYRRFGDNRGVALPLALLAFVVLAALSAALLAIGSSEVQIASNHLRNTQAQFLAEAGLEHAFNTLYNSTLTPPNLVTSAPPGLQNIPGIADNTQLGPDGSSTGRYTLRYQAAGANTVRVVSTGTSIIGGSTKVLRATMSTSFISKYAILTDEVDVGGNGRVQGPLGAIHGNNETEVGGSAFVDQTATSAGNGCDGCTDASRVGVPGASGPNTGSAYSPGQPPGLPAYGRLYFWRRHHGCQR